MFLRIFRLVLSVIILGSAAKVWSQTKPPPPVLITGYEVPVDSVYSILYITYRIPNDKLVFVKENERYSASFEFGIEVMSNDTVVQRKSHRGNIIITDYEKTKSKKDYVQGLVTFKLGSGKYKLIPEISLDNTNIDVRLKPIVKEILPYPQLPFLEPLVIKKSGGRLIFTNFENNFPFSSADYGLILPAKDSIDTLTVKISQDDNVILDTVLTDKFHGLFGFIKKENKIFLSNIHHSVNYGYFLLSGFSTKLNEGNVEIKVKGNNGHEAVFIKKVVWYTKPFILYNPEKAVELLSLIGEEKEAKLIFRHPAKLYYKKLSEYWNRKYPQKSKFNEAMNEFFTRADYALMNFNTLGKTNGLKTDRGIIYIKYGKPSSTERRYSEQNEILEIWKYDHLNKEFIFIDRTGSGNFKLLGK